MLCIEKDDVLHVSKDKFAMFESVHVTRRYQQLDLKSHNLQIVVLVIAHNCESGDGFVHAESGAIKAFASMINRNYCFVSSNFANEIYCEGLYVVFIHWLILLTSFK